MYKVLSTTTALVAFLVMFGGTPIRYGEALAGQEQARSGVCSLKTMKGTHGFSYSGTVMGSLITAVGPITFDGAGRLSATYDVNWGGTPIHGSFTGTYTVDAGCTGTVTLHLPVLGLTSNGSFIITNNGQETFFIGVDPDVTGRSTGRT